MKKQLSKNKIALLTVSVGLIINIALAGIKLDIGLKSNSLSILSDSINNFLDTFSCIIAMVAFYFIGKKKSEKFPLGYGRLEYIATLIVSILVVSVGVQFAFSAMERFMYPHPVFFLWIYVGVLIGTIIVKIGLGFFFKHMYNKTQSPVIKAIMLDSFLDAGITTMAVVSFVATALFKWKVDAIFGFVTSALIIASGVKLVKDSLSLIIGKAPNAEITAKITEIVARCNKISSFGNLIVHNYGAHDTMGTLQVAFCDSVTMAEGVALSEEISREVKLATDINLNLTLSCADNAAGTETPTVADNAAGAETPTAADNAAGAEIPTAVDSKTGAEKPTAASSATAARQNKHGRTVE